MEARRASWKPSYEDSPHGKRAALARVQVGFSVAEPAEWLGDDDEFWQAPANPPVEQFTGHVDYAGLRLSPRPFSPTPPEAVPMLTENAVRHLRLHSLGRAKIPYQTPIHIAELGSPSGEGRTAAVQVRSITGMVAALKQVAEELNIPACERFGLRGADTSGDRAVGSFGLLEDHYAPKGLVRHPSKHRQSRIHPWGPDVGPERGYTLKRNSTTSPSAMT